MTSPDPQWNAAPPTKRGSTNWGVLLLLVGGLLVAGYIVSQQSSGTSPGGNSGGGGGAHQAPVTITGSGIETSRKFHLNAGDYLVNWTATPQSDQGCYHGASLESTEVTVFELLGNELLDNATPKSGSTNLYGIEDADYYVDASSGCDWRYTFTQQ